MSLHKYTLQPDSYHRLLAWLLTPENRWGHTFGAHMDYGDCSDVDLVTIKSVNRGAGNYEITLEICDKIAVSYEGMGNGAIRLSWRSCEFDTAVGYWDHMPSEFPPHLARDDKNIELKNPSLLIAKMATAVFEAA